MASFAPGTGLWTTPLCGLTVDSRLKSVSLSHGMGLDPSHARAVIHGCSADRSMVAIVR